MKGKLKTWFSGLSGVGKVIVGSVVAGAVGTLAVAGANPGQAPVADESPSSSQQVEAETTAAPTVETKIITETEEIPFSSKTVNDSSLEKGKTSIETVGVNGVKTLTYEQTFTAGVAGDKVLVKEEITTKPITQVTAIGTKVKVRATSNCDPNYSGACVPIASDVDCAGGSGNGPAYVSGPVTVVGYDIYGLDRDGNGVGCE
jgi:resuscitation-promoting factor RpfB